MEGRICIKGYVKKKLLIKYLKNQLAGNADIFMDSFLSSVDSKLFISWSTGVGLGHKRGGSNFLS